MSKKLKLCNEWLIMLLYKAKNYLFFSILLLFFIVSLLSYEGPRHQNLGHLYRKTHNKKTKINQN